MPPLEQPNAEHRRHVLGHLPRKPLQRLVDVYDLEIADRRKRVLYVEALIEADIDFFVLLGILRQEELRQLAEALKARPAGSDHAELLRQLWQAAVELRGSIEPADYMFEERLQEIESYLDFLNGLDKQMQNGPPRIGKDGAPVSVQQQQILYSSVYLQLYNLVEATISLCIEYLSKAILSENLEPKDLTAKLRREWVRSTARTHVDLNYENRLRSALDLCEHLVQASPVSNFEVEIGGGGNWDDSAVEHIAERLGLCFRINRELYSRIKRPFRNDQGPLAFIKNLRNELAHGDVSFAECGRGITVGDLCDLKELTATYLREVISCFKKSVDDYEFLAPGRRPQGVSA